MMILKRRYEVGMRDDRTPQGYVFDFQRNVQDHVKSCEVLVDPCAKRGIAPSQDPLGGAKIRWARVRLLGKRITRSAVEFGLLVIDGFLEKPGAVLMSDEWAALWGPERLDEWGQLQSTYGAASRPGTIERCARSTPIPPEACARAR